MPCSNVSTVEFEQVIASSKAMELWLEKKKKDFIKLISNILVKTRMCMKFNKTIPLLYQKSPMLHFEQEILLHAWHWQDCFLSDNGCGQWPISLNLTSAHSVGMAFFLALFLDLNKSDSRLGCLLGVWCTSISSRLVDMKNKPFW